MPEVKTENEQTQLERWVQEMGPVAAEESMFSSYGRREELFNKLAKYEEISAVYPTRGSGQYSGSFRPGINHMPVLYHSTHDEEEIVRCWISENTSILNRSSSWGIYQNLCLEDLPGNILDAAKRVLKEKDPEGWKH